jgi:hypothetical protein
MIDLSDIAGFALVLFILLFIILRAGTEIY